MSGNGAMTYARAGVHIDSADRLVSDIAKMARRTRRDGVVAGIGGFAAVFNDRRAAKRDSYLVASTDGVGTKVELARIRDEHRTIGIDLVAMSVNDLITVGAEPLFFLDYFATGHLKPSQFRDVISGIAEGCRQSNCALIGGETAEMPGVYGGGKYDLAGFAVGSVRKVDLPIPAKIRVGDAVLGLASSGVHSNGYSLVRKIFNERELKGAWGKMLLKPTVIYVEAIKALRSAVKIKGLAHITGGGFYDNIPRVLPKTLGVRIDRSTWNVPKIFREIQKRSGISDAEMFRTFNMGIGMTAVVHPRDVARARSILKRKGVVSVRIGEIKKGAGVIIP